MNVEEAHCVAFRWQAARKVTLFRDEKGWFFLTLLDGWSTFVLLRYPLRLEDLFLFFRFLFSSFLSLDYSMQLLM